jgi:hypothetical protein
MEQESGWGILAVFEAFREDSARRKTEFLSLLRLEVGPSFVAPERHATACGSNLKESDSPARAT